MTPCEFMALSDRHRGAVELQLLPVLQFARFASIWVNVNPNIHEQHRNSVPADFIPKMRQEVKPEEVQASDVKVSAGSLRMSTWRSYAQLVESKGR